jgi:hypothetical protein
MLRVSACSKHPSWGCRDVRTKLSTPKFMLRHAFITILLSPLQYYNFTRVSHRPEGMRLRLLSTSKQFLLMTRGTNLMQQLCDARSHIHQIPACTYTWTIDTRQAYQNTHVPLFLSLKHMILFFYLHDSRTQHVFVVTCITLPNSAPFLHTCS